MKPYDIIVCLMCLASLFAYINARFIRLHQTIGVMLLSLGFSLSLVVLNHFFPAITAGPIKQIASIDFHDLLINGMLCLLLFAGSLHIDALSLRKERLPIILFSSVGVLISTFVVGVGMYLLLSLFGYTTDMVYCLLFAALIAPTDPIAVIAILKRAGLPLSLETKIAGESLFNDGVAVVVFLTILEVAQAGVGSITVPDVALLFLRNAFGGLLFGVLLGYFGAYLLRTIDKNEVEMMITVALVMGGYLLASYLSISGPLAVVVAGIIIGNDMRKQAAVDKTKEYLEKVWALFDEILNAVLFMLIGLEMLVIRIDRDLIIIGLIAIPITLFARWISIAAPYIFLRRRVKFARHAVIILTWGGLRGGLSVALALSIPVNMFRDQFVSITYMIVIFSILVQGMTVGRVYRALREKDTSSLPKRL